MYLAVLAIIVGQAASFGDLWLLGYALIVATAFVSFVQGPESAWSWSGSGSV